MSHSTHEKSAADLARLQHIVEDLLGEARRQGASAAEASVGMSAGLEVAVRLGEVETVEHIRDNGLGITVYFGQRRGSASTSDLSPEAVRETVRAACSIAAHTQEDGCAGLADPELLARELHDLDLYHPWSISVEEAIERAVACEAAARALDPRICNSDGASLSTHSGVHVYGNTQGFIGGYPTSRHGLNCSIIAQEGERMQRDDWWTSARAPEDLDAPETVGRRAAERALARLGARRLGTCEAPVIFRAEVATSLLRSFIAAIHGGHLYRKSSFLLDRLGTRVFPDWVRIHEQPHLPRGLASAPFDSDGVATHAKDLVHAGMLESYVLDVYSARRLGLQTTGNAGGVRNLRIEPGALDRAGLLREMGTGLLVTELMGQGVNLVTGDYSRGASGFWVENGEIQYPVEEITIASNLERMFAGLAAVADDCDYQGGTQSGSWLIERMTIAGE